MDRWRGAAALIFGSFLGVAIGVAVALVGSGSASAQNPPPGSPFTPGNNMPRTVVVSVQSEPSGVVVYIRTEDSEPGRSTAPTTTTQPSSGGSNCTVQPINIGNASAGGWFATQAPQHPGQVPYALECGGAFQGIVWLPAEASSVRVLPDPGGAVDPMTLVMSLLASIRLPDMRIRFNPETGLVALPAWFWVDGYDGAPIRRVARLGAVIVEVELTPSGYRWAFGDGATLETLSLGRPYPQESDLQHTYERSSLGAGGQYRVTLDVTWAVRFRVNGGPWQALPSMTRSFVAAYPVQQAQSVLTGR